MIEPGDVAPEQLGFLTDLTASVEDTCATASRLVGADAEPLVRWFSLELERFQLVAAALRRTASDHHGDLAAKNPSEKAVQEHRAEVAQEAERFSVLAAAVLDMCPEEPPEFLASLASADDPVYAMSARRALTQFATEMAKGSLSPEFVESLRKGVSAGLASAARPPEDVLGPRPKVFGRAKWDEQHAKWLIQQRSDACETLGKYRVLRMAGEAQTGQAETLRSGVEALDAVLAFDRDPARGSTRADLERRFDQLFEMMWREVTKVRPLAERREDLDEFAHLAEDGHDEFDEAVRALQSGLKSERVSSVAPGDVFQEARDAMEDFFGDDDEE